MEQIKSPARLRLKVQTERNMTMDDETSMPPSGGVRKLKRDECTVGGALAMNLGAFNHGPARLFSFAAALTLLFSIKQNDSLLEFFKDVRVGFVACVKDYLLKRDRTDLLVHVYQNESPSESWQTEHNIKHCFDLL
jgi:hypothetical protein